MTHKHSLFLRNKLGALRRKRLARVRQKVRGTSERPRLSVFRSHRHIYAQVIDDQKGVTLAAAQGGAKIEVAKQVGEAIAQKALVKKIHKVVFDRGWYKFHGRIKALAEAAKEKGLEF